MQQRTKRLLMIWLGVIAHIVAFSSLGLGAGWILRQLPFDIAAALVIVALVIFAGWVAFELAKIKLENKEYTEARVLRELRKGYNE
jgi:membrane protease YdiL (CAAX protease family)